MYYIGQIFFYSLNLEYKFYTNIFAESFFMRLYFCLCTIFWHAKFFSMANMVQNLRQIFKLYSVARRHRAASSTRSNVGAFYFDELLTKNAKQKIANKKWEVKKLKEVKKVKKSRDPKQRFQLKKQQFIFLLSCVFLVCIPLFCLIALLSIGLCHPRWIWTPKKFYYVLRRITYRSQFFMRLFFSHTVYAKIFWFYAFSSISQILVLKFLVRP